MKKKGMDQTTWIIIGIALGLLILGILALIASGKFSSFSSFVDTILGRSSEKADCAEAISQCGLDCLSDLTKCPSKVFSGKSCLDWSDIC